MKTSLEIQKIRASIEQRKNLAEQLASSYPDVIILRKDQPENEYRTWYASVVHPSSRTKGRWQVSVFDDDGFCYDHSEKSYVDAIYSALQTGCVNVDMDLLERVGETPRFMAGVIWSQLPDDQKWSTRVADIREKLENKLSFERMV